MKISVELEISDMYVQPKGYTQILPLGKIYVLVDCYRNESFYIYYSLFFFTETQLYNGA